MKDITEEAQPPPQRPNAINEAPQKQYYEKSDVAQHKSTNYFINKIVSVYACATWILCILSSSNTFHPMFKQNVNLAFVNLHDSVITLSPISLDAAIILLSFPHFPSPLLK